MRDRHDAPPTASVRDDNGYNALLVQQFQFAAEIIDVRKTVNYISSDVDYVAQNHVVQIKNSVQFDGAMSPSALAIRTRRPASADRTARRQFHPTGQSVSRTQASDAMTSRLPRYEAKCVQRRCFQCGLVPLRSDIKGTELPPANILIPLERQLIALQLCR